MTTYKDIRGTHIKTVTSDPPAPVNGQMWYNSTTQVMKGLTSNPAGTDNTEGIHFGGRNEPTIYASTEEFSSGAVSTKTISTD